MKRREKRMDVDAWVRGFMSGMNSIQAASSTEQPGDGCRKFSLTQPPSEATLGNSLELKLGPYVQMSSKLGVILDFDGTLSGLAKGRYLTYKFGICWYPAAPLSLIHSRNLLLRFWAVPSQC